MTSILAERTVLTPLAETDIPDMLEMYLEEGIFNYIPHYQNKTKEEYTDLLKERIALSAETPWFETWVARLKEDGTFIGSGNLNTNVTLEVTQIGWIIKSQHAGKGFATEIGREMLKYGLDTVKLPKVYAVCDKENVASIRVVEKLGLTFDRSEDDGGEINIYQKTSNEND